MNLDKLKKWSAPSDWMKVTTIDAHTEGEPLRIFTSGLPRINWKVQFSKKENTLRKNLII